MTSQGVSATWEAFYAALQTLLPSNFLQTTYPTTAGDASTLVSPGDPGDYTPDLIIAMMGLRMPIKQPTLGTNRSQDLRPQIDLAISAYVYGGPEAQPVANDRGWAAHDAILAYLRTSPNEHLGGACYNSIVVSAEMTPVVAWDTDADMPEPNPVGRICAISMITEHWIRI